MKQEFRPLHSVLVGLALGVAGSAHASQPPDVVASDSLANTAMGTQALQSLTTGFNNTSAGYNALISNTTGNNNTAFGSGALLFNGSAANNTAVGFNTLYFSVGTGNSALGASALYNNTDGTDNTGLGTSALYSNTGGSYNAAVGAGALYANTNGLRNTAFGFESLGGNSTGNDNSASGYYALYSNTTGAGNTGSGSEALYSNTTGTYNSATGYHSLLHNTTGIDNTAIGYESLHSSTTGSNNIAVGWSGGANLTTGSNNIDIGNEGSTADKNTIRIGVSGTQTATYVAGISTSKITGSAVYVTSSGQLGVLASSERYKTRIAPMGSNTEKLLKLRPVTFHLKSEPRGEMQYGLIAEDVVNVFPELVTRNASGGIEGVRYDELAPMLLNELQKYHQAMTAQAETIAALDARVRKDEALAGERATPPVAARSNP